MDDRTFRNAMGKFATGVTVITTKLNDQIHGMTANAFMSVSLDPKLIAVSVDEKASMHDKMEKSKKFAVSTLSEEQQDVSMHFAGQKKKEYGETDFDWMHQVPVIKNAIATIVCSVYDSYKVGDHTIYIGEVINVKEGKGNPLTFYQGRYGVEKNQP